MTRALAACVALACIGASGCSLIYGVDVSQYGRDGGIDAGPDARIDTGMEDAGDGGDEPDAQDAGTDATLDGWICPMRFERTCTGGIDEDCDGFVDCEDSDCATSLACCSDRGALFPTETFSTFPADWSWVPSADGPIVQADDFLLDFGDFGHPRAVRVDECLPIDLGVRVTAQLTPLAEPPRCPGTETDCDNYAAVLITESTDASPPDTLAENFAVRVYRDGHAEIRAAGEVLRDSTSDGVTFSASSAASAIVVTIELTPGVHTAGIPYVFATVRMTQGGTSWPVTTGMMARPFQAEAIFPRAYLRGAEIGCTGARGLMLSFEGYGSSVRVDNVGVARFGCANPAHFEPAGAEIEADDLDGALPSTDTDDWTQGGLGSPSIQSFATGAGAERTELFYDASNRDRTLEPTDGVRYSIGASYSTMPDGLGGYVPRRTGAPVLGLRPPDCLGTMMPPGGCGARRSWREPAIYVPVAEDRRIMGTALGLVYARETGPLSNVFEIGAAAGFLADSAFSEMDPLPATGDGCDSRRDPVLVPLEPGGTLNDLAVLYTCDRVGMPSTIRALLLDQFPPVGPDDVHVVPDAVITGGVPGSFASEGVRAADAAVWFRGTGAEQEIVMRVWYLTIARSTDPATVSFSEGTGPVGELPALYPYPANPVLRSTDPVLGACDAAGDCQIESVAVTRLANEPDTVRLLVSRTPETAGGIRHVLVPLDQVWPPLR